MKDFLSVADFDPTELATVLARAAAVKQDAGAVAGRFRGLRIGLFFEKPSARTRISTEVASADLGMVPVVLKGDEIGLGKREAVEDVARVFDRYLDALALRVYDHEHLRTIADHAAAPVINLLSDLEHPCQALADLQTIAETRPLEETVVAYLGDGNNVAHSLMLGAAMSGMSIRVITPPGYEPADGVRDHAVKLAAKSGGDVEVTNDVAAVAGAHVVYTDVWASMGQEDEAEARNRLFAGYRVTTELFDTADPAGIFLHCLPAHRGEEVTHEVLEHPRSRIFDQAENRLHAFKGLLVHLLGT